MAFTAHLAPAKYIIEKDQIFQSSAVLDSSSQSLAFSILLAMASTSFSVSCLETAARTSNPLPMEETNWPSTVTDADLTLCSTARQC